MKVFFSSKRPLAISIVELVLAISVCGMALLALLGVQSRVHQALQDDVKRSRARVIVESLMKQSEARLRGDFESELSVTNLPVLSDFEGHEDYRFSIKQEVEPSSPDLKRIEVTVSWNEGEIERKETLWCLFANNE